jgi:hypothetical protein
MESERSTSTIPKVTIVIKLLLPQNEAVTEKSMLHFIFFWLYVGSISLAAVASHSFLVMSVGELLLFIGIAFTGPLAFVALIFKDSARLAVAVVHVLIAIAIHPTMEIEEHYEVGVEEQMELLARANLSRDSESWWNRADAANALATALRKNANSSIKRESLLMYWLFPPSTTLAIWALVIYWLLPYAGLSTRPREG